ncbi:ABC transporter substrate-binding protein [Rhizobium sp. DKSPLA3]|uniref:ABC transporter substrate-binding protein n=1 Tax=Rhizobium quercicola TaxID=2901226 RepID=A0A9X1SZU8_9HYPH|nr:ABC transporter substrate-binding protein [Rhizobium quercicola]MCD7108025.1 ABC transporter substrate-binding protein [Rhizobium quercicola]
MRLLRSAVLTAAFVASAWTLLSAGTAGATDYPLVIKDLSGREITIPAEPKRIVVQDGRDLFALALLDRADPFARVVAWNNILSRSDPASWAVFQKQWPESSAKPIDMKFDDEGQVNLEQVAATKPDLLVFQTRVRQALDDADLFNRLAKLGIPIVLIDTELEPTVNAPKTVNLLGKVLNRETEAKAFTDFYAERLAKVQAGFAGAEKPKVFVEAKAGQKGLDSCCFTHGDVYWGKLVADAGGINIGTQLVKGRTGDVTTETLMAEKPDVFVMTGSPFSNEGSVSPAFGLNADKAAVEASLRTLSARKGFSYIKAVEENRVVGLYHQLYASAWNIYAVEYLAKAFYPERFAELDPDADLATIIGSFTGLPKGLTTVYGAKAAPAK